MERPEFEQRKSKYLDVYDTPNYTEKMVSGLFLILPIYCKYHPPFKLHKQIFYVSVSYVKVCAKFLIFTLKWS